MLLAITNRKLCQEDFFQRIEKIAEGRPDGILLREKDLEENTLVQYAEKCKSIAEEYQVPFGINGSVSAAEKLKISWLHFSVEAFRNFNKEDYPFVKRTGVSIHSVEEAVEMEQLGASYLIAGHIFLTDCKKGIPARGLDFLQSVCSRVSIPIFAIGGITKDRRQEVLIRGASGYCVMSHFMTCQEPKKEVEAFKNLRK